MVQETRWLARLALITAFLTVLLIVVGAIVRVTDSGLGCGSSWPLCDGKIIPPLDNLTAWIEWSHRLFAMLIGVLGLATLVTAWRSKRENRFAFIAVVIAALLYTVQSLLGRQVVVHELRPVLVALHLGTAMLLLASLLAASVAATYRPEKRIQTDSVTLLTYITTVLSLVIILTGALVRGSGATLACTDWPLCNGAVIPTGQGQAALIHMTHRFAVVALGISLLLLVWQALQAGRSGQIRRVAVLALVVYLAQAAVGALFVLTQAGRVWGAAHVGLAAATWALLVMLSVMEYLQTSRQDTTVWQSQSKTALN
jgi:heme A synthase